MDDYDDDIPDLDDMSDMVAGIRLNQQAKHAQPLITSGFGDSSKSSTQVSDKSKPKSQHIGKANIDKATKPKDQFGGMKKGFLFGRSSAKASTKSSTSSKVAGNEEIISPKNNHERNSLVLDEVQEAMKQNVIQDKSWLTEDLLSQISSNEKLSKQLTDPRISKAVSWMQKDPKAAMEYYKDDIEVQNFFKEFYGILGHHFTNLSSEQDTATGETGVKNRPDPDDEKAMQKILSNVEIKQILSKPSIQKLLHELRTNPDEAQKTLNSNDRAFRDDVNKLVEAGLLAFQPN